MPLIARSPASYLCLFMSFSTWLDVSPLRINVRSIHLPKMLSVYPQSHPRTQVTFYFFFLVSLKSICECHSNFLNFRPRKVERQKLQDDDDDTLLYLCLFFSLFVCLNLYFKSIYLTLYCLKTSKTVKGGRAVALSFFLSFLFVSALFQNIFRRLSRFKTLLSVSLHTPLFKLCDVPLHQINLSSFVYKSCLFFSIFGRCKIRQNTSAKGLVV